MKRGFQAANYQPDESSRREISNLRPIARRWFLCAYPSIVASLVLAHPPPASRVDRRHVLRRIIGGAAAGVGDRVLLARQGAQPVACGLGPGTCGLYPASCCLQPIACSLQPGL